MFSRTNSTSRTLNFFSVAFRTMRSCQPQSGTLCAFLLWAFASGTNLDVDLMPLFFKARQVSPLKQPTRLEINEFIKSHPEVHFRGICNSLGFIFGCCSIPSMGARALWPSSKLPVMAKTKDTSKPTLLQSDMKAISLTRHKTTAKILIILSQNPSALHNDIACNLGVSSQTLTWQMNKLKKWV